MKHIYNHIYYAVNLKCDIYIHIYPAFTSASKCIVHLLHVYTTVNERLTPALPDLFKTYYKLHLLPMGYVNPGFNSFTVHLANNKLDQNLRHIYNHVNPIFHPVRGHGHFRAFRPG